MNSPPCIPSLPSRVAWHAITIKGGNNERHRRKITPMAMHGDSLALADLEIRRLYFEVGQSSLVAGMLVILVFRRVYKGGPWTQCRASRTTTKA